MESINNNYSSPVTSTEPGAEWKTSAVAFFLLACNSMMLVTNLGASPDLLSTYVLGGLGLVSFALCIIMINYSVLRLRYRMDVDVAASGFLAIIWMLFQGISRYCFPISEQGLFAGKDTALIVTLIFVGLMISMALVIYKFVKHGAGSQVSE